jgi:glyceraldehyde 3-phosphate dehydrogenase
MTRRARVAIHGFGRTGRQTFKAIWRTYEEELELAAVGLLVPEDAAAAAHLLKYDSNYGQFEPPVAVVDGCLKVGGRFIPLVSAPSPAALPWQDLGIDIVIEATGAYVSNRMAARHQAAGARKVIITADSEDADLSLIYGVNESDYDPQRHHVIATESGTANALAVILKVLGDHFEVRNALMTAVRAFSNTQKLLDSTDHDLRRARSAPTSIVPTTSRAARAIDQVLPRMAGRVSGYGVHVPVPTVSILELTAHLDSAATTSEINDAFRRAAMGSLAGVLAVADEPLVSSDYVGDSHSAVVDALVTVTVGPLAKVGAWYDNEWGYSHRVADVAALVGRGLE